jgi:hypothetical protein
MTIGEDIITVIGLVDDNRDTAIANLEAAKVQPGDGLWIRRNVGGKTWKLGYSCAEDGGLRLVIKERA